MAEWRSALPSAYYEPLWPLNEEQQRADYNRYYKEQEPRFNALMEAYRPFYERQLAMANAGDPRYSYLKEREATGRPWWEYFVPQKLFDPWKQWLTIAGMGAGAGPRPYARTIPATETLPEVKPNIRPEEPTGYWDWLF